MKKIITIYIILTLAMISTPVFAAKDIVLEHIEAEDIEDAALSWGLKVSEHTGNYGGMNYPEDGRLVDDGDNMKGPAQYTFTWDHAAAQTLIIRHLDGIADDSFNVEVENKKGKWILIGVYEDKYTSEKWEITTFELKGGKNVMWAKGTGEMKIRIVRTAGDWSGYGTYGQLAIDWMELRGNGKPR